MDDIHTGDKDVGPGLRACGLYREVPVRAGAPASSSEFAVRQSKLVAQQPELIGSIAGRTGRLAKKTE